jgi:hypothetical protein
VSSAMRRITVSKTSWSFPQSVWISLWMASGEDYKCALFMQFPIRLVES